MRRSIRRGVARSPLQPARGELDLAGGAQAGVRDRVQREGVSGAGMTNLEEGRPSLESRCWAERGPDAPPLPFFGSRRAAALPINRFNGFLRLFFQLKTLCKIVAVWDL